MGKLRKMQASFGRTPNELLNNKLVSLKAKGIYAYIDSKPDGWDFSAARIAYDSKEGLDAVSSGIKELENIGYLERKRYQDENGYWQVDYIILDSLSMIHQNRQSLYMENPTLDYPTQENPDTGKSPNNSKKEVSKKDISKKEVTTVSKNAEVDTVSKLYYDYLKKYSIPVINHRTLRIKISELKRLRGEEWCIKYLTFMIETYESIDISYKPRISNSLDLFSKSATIEETMKKLKEDETIY